METFHAIIIIFRLDKLVVKGNASRKWEDDLENDPIDPGTDLLTLQCVYIIFSKFSFQESCRESS